MLITYSDSLGKNLKDLKQVLEGPLKDVVGGVHILPSFHRQATAGLHPWTIPRLMRVLEIGAILRHSSQDYYLMFDFMINHISAKSPYFLDFLEKKDDPPMRQGETEGREGIMGYRSHRMRREQTKRYGNRELHSVVMPFTD